MSAELESPAAITGAQLALEQGSQLFETLTLICLSDQSVAKAIQEIWTEVQAQEQEWIEQSHDEQWLQTQQRLAGGPERLYGSLDGVKVHIRGDRDHP
jgi:bisphosphoglycerate-dependent phosphoglycerate mutase